MGDHFGRRLTLGWVVEFEGNSLRSGDTVGCDDGHWRLYNLELLGLPLLKTQQLRWSVAGETYDVLDDLGRFESCDVVEWVVLGVVVLCGRWRINKREYQYQKQHRQH